MWQKILHKKRLKTTQVQALSNWIICLSFQVSLLIRISCVKCTFWRNWRNLLTLLRFNWETPLETIWDSKTWQTYYKLLKSGVSQMNVIISTQHWHVAGMMTTFGIPTVNGKFSSFKCSQIISRKIHVQKKLVQKSIAQIGIPASNSHFGSPKSIE